MPFGSRCSASYSILFRKKQQELAFENHMFADFLPFELSTTDIYLSMAVAILAKTVILSQIQLIPPVHDL